MEAGEAESLSSLAPHQLQGLLDAALRSSSLAASPHVDVLGGGVGGGDGGGGGGGVGVLGVRVDRRSILQLVTAATVSGGQQVGGGLLKLCMVVCAVACACCALHCLACCVMLCLVQPSTDLLSSSPNDRSCFPPVRQTASLPLRLSIPAGPRLLPACCCWWWQRQ